MGNEIAFEMTFTPIASAEKIPMPGAAARKESELLVAISERMRAVLSKMGIEVEAEVPLEEAFFIRAVWSTINWQNKAFKDENDVSCGLAEADALQKVVDPMFQWVVAEATKLSQTV